MKKFPELLTEATVNYVITTGTWSCNFWQTYSPTSSWWILSNQSAFITHVQRKDRVQRLYHVCRRILKFQAEILLEEHK